MSTGPILQPLTVQPTGRQPAPRHPGTWNSPSAAWLNRHRQAASRTVVGVGGRGHGGMKGKGRKREEGGETQNKSQTLECVRILMFSPTHHPKSKGKTYEIQQQKFTSKTPHEMIQIRDGQTALHEHFYNCYKARALFLKCTCVLRAVKSRSHHGKVKTQNQRNPNTHGFGGTELIVTINK